MDPSPETIIDSAGAPLFAAIRDADTDVFLSSPYVSRGVATQLANLARTSRAHWRLLTNVNVAAIANGYLSTSGLRELIAAGITVRHLPNLHAKAQIVDTFGIVGSANLTNAGLALGAGRNAEASVVLAPHQVSATRAMLALWWDDSEIVDESALERAESLAAALPSARKPSRSSPARTLELDVEHLLADARDADRSLWIKAQSGAPYPDRWRVPHWFSNPGPGKPSLKAGDLVLIYAKNIHGCYAVVEITDDAVHDPDFVSRNSGGNRDIGMRWPWVNRTRPRFTPDTLSVVGMDQIGVSPFALQGGRKRLTHNEFACAVRSLEQASSRI
ncbi:phospholipase D-like domain-containing protein [Gordonia terrae]